VTVEVARRRAVSWQPIDAPKEDIAAAARNFRKKARFLVDESLGLETAKFLRELGWNVKDVSEVGLSGRSDEDIGLCLSSEADTVDP
jgi:hypothetical protein